MNTNGNENPYESPRAPNQVYSVPNIRLDQRVVRVIALAAAGYASFALFALVYSTLSFLISSEFGIVDWRLGVLVAVTLASSELLNQGQGKRAGVLRRILVAFGSMLMCMFVASAISSMVGWRQTTYHSDPWLAARFAILFAFYSLTLIALRFIWAKSSAESPAKEDGRGHSTFP